MSPNRLFLVAGRVQGHCFKMTQMTAGCANNDPIDSYVTVAWSQEVHKKLFKSQKVVEARRRVILIQNRRYMM